MTNEQSERKLATLLINGRKKSDVEEIIGLATKMYGVSWRALGDRPNNIGTVGIGSEPGLAIVERVTNMFDAMLELGHALNPGTKASSPREAASEYYGIPKMGLADIDEPRPIAEKMILSLEDSGNKYRPSVVIRDKGIGETSRSFPKTILSLNESNKVDKPWTMGTYGQGGSVTYGFCESTIIVSRRHPALLNGITDHVAWTIVKKRYDSSKKLPNYEYLVGTDNEVFSLSPSIFSDLEHGTQVTHIEYDLQISGPFTTNPFQFFNAALFDPVLPFLLTGNRGKEKDYGSRVIVGNSARLQNIERAKGDIEIAHTDSIKLDLGKENGSPVVQYWVLRRPLSSDSKTDPTSSYVDAKSAVSMTLHGQRHDAEERYWIKTRANLSFLYKLMIIQIDATELTGAAKAELFASTRERGRKSGIRMKLYDTLAYSLSNDPHLKLLNYEEKERILKKSTAVANEKIRKRLGKFIKHKLEEFSKTGKGKSKGTSGSGGNGGIKPKKKKGKPGKPRDISDAHLPNDPTYLRFKKKQIKIRQAERAHVVVEINAKNQYLPKNDSFLEISFKGLNPENLRVISRSSLMGGQSRWIIEAEEHAQLGAYILDAKLSTPSGPLEDKLSIEVLEKRTAQKKDKGGSEPETGPEIIWVKREDWDDHEMDAKIVGRVHEDTDSTIIAVNRNYDELDNALKGRDLTEDQISTRADRYLFPVACGLWLQEYQITHVLPEESQKPPDRYLEAEMRRLADAVLVAVDPDVNIAAEEEDYK